MDEQIASSLGGIGEAKASSVRFRIPVGKDFQPEVLQKLHVEVLLNSCVHPELDESLPFVYVNVVV